MKKLILLAVLCLHPLHALLPPLWESVSQIKAILSDESLKDYLDSAELIESITRVEDGYLLRTNHSQLRAEITAAPQMRPGPAVYKVRFSKVST